MSVPSENVSEVVDRKELLEQQFEQAENTEQPAEIAARDDSGKFVKQETAEEPVWKRPPASWKKDYHEAWATADPRIQEYAWQREEQMRKGVQPLLSKAQYADDMQKVMAPYENTIRGLGMEPTQAVKALMEADHTLRTTNGEQRAAYFRQLAQQYGVSLDGNSNFPQVDQNYSSLQNELIDLRGKLTSWEQQTEAQQNQVLLNEIDQFSQGAEHFESVRPTMIQLLQGGVAETLQEAYDKAVRIDDNLYESMVQSQQAEKASKPLLKGVGLVHKIIWVFSI